MITTKLTVARLAARRDAALAAGKYRRAARAERALDRRRAAIRARWARA